MIFKELATFFSLKNLPNLFSFRFGTFCSRAQPPEVVVSDTIVELFISIFLCFEAGLFVAAAAGRWQISAIPVFRIFLRGIFSSGNAQKGPLVRPTACLEIYKYFSFKANIWRMQRVCCWSQAHPEQAERSNENEPNGKGKKRWGTWLAFVMKEKEGEEPFYSFFYCSVTSRQFCLEKMFSLDNKGITLEEFNYGAEWGLCSFNH